MGGGDFDPSGPSYLKSLLNRYTRILDQIIPLDTLLNIIDHIAIINDVIDYNAMSAMTDEQRMNIYDIISA